MTEEDFDLRHHKQLTAQRNFDMVMFDSWKIKPWCAAPLGYSAACGACLADLVFGWAGTSRRTHFRKPKRTMSSTPPAPATRIPGVTRATVRSHGRTSDLLAGGLLRPHTGESMLWVCHFCFKYMADGVPWELHKVRCR